MYTEARKIQLITEVLKVSSEATLEELESVLKKKSLQHRKVKNPSIYDFVGVVSKKESEQMKQAIKDSCETAMYYGEIMANLFKKGKPIPTNDVWIAAIAKQHKLTIITKDKHFKEIEGITVKYW